MDKLQWFKFTPSDWMMGKIQKCPPATRGMFVNLCCLYWNKECDLSLEDAEIEVDEEHLSILIKKKVIKVEGEDIRIEFLDDQFDGIKATSEKNRTNGLKGGRPSKALKGKLNLYFVRLFNENESFLKVGITSSSVRRRMNNIPYQHELLHEIELDSFEALNIENLIFGRFDAYSPLKDFGGKTECITDTSDNKIQIASIMQNPNKTQTEPNQKPTKPYKSKTTQESEKTKQDKKSEIPSFEDFKTHAHLKLTDLGKKNLQAYDYAIKAKYEAWIENDWHDGNGNKILGWKSKLTNTVGYLQPTQSNDTRTFTFNSPVL